MAEADLILSIHADGSTTQYRSYADMGADVVAEVERPRIVPSDSAEKYVPISAPGKKAPPDAKKQQSQTAADKEKEKEKEKARRSGDLRCYQTYGQSMGWSRAWVFLVIAILFAVASKISRTLASCIACSCILTTNEDRILGNAFHGQHQH